MNQARATHKDARMAPRKIRPLAAALRGISATAAQEQLRYIPGKASQIIREVLKSAIANAVENHDMKADTLQVAQVEVNEGLKMSRYRAAARGQAHPITKRTSHVTVVVEGTAGKARKTKKTEIETVTADVYAATSGKQESVEGEVDDVSEKDAKSAALDTAAKQAESFKDKETKKQTGVKYKTHRRKSI